MADLHHQALSITSVFVALAVGVAAGAAAVGGRLGSQEEVLARLERQFAALQAQLTTAATRVRQTQAALRLHQQVLERMTPAVASSYFTGLPVRVEVSPGAQEPGRAVAGLLAESGAHVERKEVSAPGAPPFVLLSTPCSTVAGFVGPPVPGAETRLPPALGSAAARPRAWVWEVESPLGRLSLLVSVIDNLTGYVSARHVVGRLGGLGARDLGERRRACL